MATFLARAKSIFAQHGKSLVYHDEFKKAFDWIDKLRSTSYYVDIDLNNLEHVFSAAFLAKETGDAQAAEVFECLKFVIMETLDHSCMLDISSRGTSPNPDPTYKSFVGCIRSACGAPEHSRLDPIITFNYDVLLDHAITKSGHGIDYGSTPLYPDRAPLWPLYKLHGSLNWAVCNKCERQDQSPQVLAPHTLPPGVSYQSEAFGSERNLQVQFRMATHTMHKTPCTECGEFECLRPLVVPPTWAKTPASYHMEEVWSKAIDALSKATQIIVIGYSLPPSDMAFQYLMALGLQNNADLRRVVVIDPSDDPRKRYEQVFARGMSERNQLIFIKQSFRDFAEKKGEPSERISRILRFADVTP